MHWANVDGRAVIVGLDVRSFTDVFSDVYPGPVPVGEELAEVSQRVIRGIPISRIRDLTREQLIDAAWESMLAIRSAPLKPDGSAPDESDFPVNLMSPDETVAHDQHATEQISMLTAKGEPRKRLPPATEELLRRVAGLYTRAVASGDKAPAKYVEEKLREAGEPRLSSKGSRVQVRQWIRRARERGYLTVQSPKGEGV